MIHFASAKAKVDAEFYVHPDGANFGPGFTINDAHTMEVERARYTESHDPIILRGQRAEFAGNYTELAEYDNHYMTTLMRAHFLRSRR